MRKIFIICMSLVANMAYGQTTVTLYPGGPLGKEGGGLKEDPAKLLDTSEHNNFIAAAWTGGGSTLTYRSTVPFDLSEIPAGATINSATLYLYANTTSSFAPIHSHYPGSPYPLENSTVIERIITPWHESTICWNNLPITTSAHALYLPPTTSQTQNFSLNAKDIVQDMISHPDSSFGFMIRLLDETYYRSVVFAAGRHENPELWPKLVINYTVPTRIETNISPSESINVGPTIFFDHINIQSTKSHRADVFMTDMNGKKVLAQTGINLDAGQLLTINTNSLAPGIYFLHLLENDNPFFTKKIIKQ